ncbi:MAG: hypothetical protein INQ03_14465 [Candidatus Heimdallarchaeota archaeon]|nr:hypothetical protein [Candidatus Heimdallarchaeota archaeon]
MSHKLPIGLVFAFTLGLLIISPLGVANQSLPGTSISPSAVSFTNDIDEEYAKLVPGIGSSVYAEILRFGGVNGSFSSFQPSLEYFMNKANWWAMSCIDSDPFSDHLNKNPFPLPDGWVFTMDIPNSFTNFDLTTALEGVQSSISFDAAASIIDEDDTSITYAFTIADTCTGQSIVDFINSYISPLYVDGYLSSLTATLESNILAAEVAGAYVGVTSIAGKSEVVSAVGFVKADGITGSSTKSISSNNILGAITPSSELGGLSKIEIVYPYPIKVTSFSPSTSNPLPHVTGKFIWDQRSPVSSYSLGTAADYTVSYTIASDYAFPNVINTLDINQTKLQSDGILDAIFTLINTGSDPASNIILELPLGPDFGNIANLTHPEEGKLEIDVIRSQYTLDEAYTNTYNVSIVDDNNANNTFTYQAFELKGWYTEASNPILWNTSDSLIIHNGSGVLATIESTGGNTGFPEPLIYALETLLLPELQNLTKANDILLKVKAQLDDTFELAFQKAKEIVYEAKKTFKLFENDFTLETRQVPDINGVLRTEFFLTTTVASLAAGANETLGFSITNIPVETDTFASFYFKEGKEKVTEFGYPNGVLTSSSESFFELMQYTFMRQNFSGMPFYIFENLDYELLSGETNEDLVTASGLPFTYENAEGFPFFGVSNGLNIQVADSQAVLAVTVSTDDSAYTVGETATATVNIENIGDAVASDVVVNLKLGILGRDWKIEKESVLNVTEIDEIAIGETVSFTVDLPTNSFLGFRPLYAEVFFTSEKGDSNPVIQDYYNLGIKEFTYGGEVRLHTTSNLAGSLLSAESQLAKPAVPVPTFISSISFSNIEATTNTDNNGYDVVGDYTIVVQNVGDAPGTFNIFWDLSGEQFVIDITSNEGITCTIHQINYPTCGSASVSTELTSGSQMQFTGTYKIWNWDSYTPVYGPSVVISYLTEGENALGDTFTFDQVAGIRVLDLDADTAASGEGRTDANEESSSSSFSARSSVGASVDTELGGDDVATVSIDLDLGSTSNQLLGLVMATFTLTIIKRRKH